MPAIIELRKLEPKDCPFPSLFFLLKEPTFPREGLEVLQQRILNAIKFEKATEEDILLLAETTIEEFNCTILPFSLYTIKY